MVNGEKWDGVDVSEMYCVELPPVTTTGLGRGNVHWLFSTEVMGL